MVREAGPLFAMTAPEPEVEKPAPSVVKTKIYTVGELAAKVKGTLEGTFATVVVQGELSGVKLHSSGHFYCDIKDETAVLNAVAWKGTVGRWGSIPTSGTLVVAKGRLTTYPARSSYQLVIDTLEPAGLGALMQQLEALKRKLAEEGLFDGERKRELPFLPRRIGIITSPTGAVIRDMLHRLEDRCPREVVLWPVAVQGQTAAAEVAAAIEGFNRMPEAERPDVLIVARGGGSFEDLMPFNAEVLVRAVAGSGIPVISGVGHEPDVTLCDLAADLRAPTPTAAAEKAVDFLRDDMLDFLNQTRRRMAQVVRAQIAQWGTRVDMVQRLLPDPMRVVMQLVQRLDDCDLRLRRNGEAIVPTAVQRVEALERLLTAHNPRLPLERGYVFVTRDGEMVRTAKAASGLVDLHFADGVRAAVME